MNAKILILGAGKSATVLIQYLQKKAIENNWYITLADSDINLAEKKWNKAKNGHAIAFDINDPILRSAQIESHSIVVSMLPAALHFLVAKDCLKHNKSLFTASYVDENLNAIASEIKEKKLLFLCEMGLDPGIDHMSAMQLVHRIQNMGGVITEFKSHCGGLIAPESDNNPWHYKISWNPRNIILAGKTGALFLEDGKQVEKKYETLFSNVPNIEIANIGTLSYYPNRDSISYINTYDLKSATNFVRTTLRNPRFMYGWNAIVKLGLTSENSIIRKDTDSIKTWFEMHIQNQNLTYELQQILLDKILKNQFEYLDLKSNKIIPLELNSNASILQWILEDKWKLSESDKDMVVMMHEITYELKNTTHKIQSSMVVIGTDSTYTAMAKTVGLPLAMGVCAYLKGEIILTGLQIPTHPSIYNPILKTLAEEGIVFEEKNR